MIQPVNTITDRNPTFGMYRHDIVNKAGQVINRGETYMFRRDLNFGLVAAFLGKKYAGVPEVNVVAHACSDGEEAYSLLTKMHQYLGPEKLRKFLPFHARDLEQTHIWEAKRGIYELGFWDWDNLKRGLGYKFTNYFDVVGYELFHRTIKVKDGIKGLVEFKQGNLVKDAKSMDFENTVLLARNCWLYLSREDRRELLETLSERMPRSATLVIGDVDKDICRLDRHLMANGFMETVVRNVYERV